MAEHDITSKTCSQIYSERLGYRFDSLPEMVEHFKSLDKNAQDKFCGWLVDHLDIITDIENANVFMRIRNDHLQITRV